MDTSKWRSGQACSDLVPISEDIWASDEDAGCGGGESGPWYESSFYVLFGFP